MGNMDQHLGNATSTTFLQQLRGMWKSPRGAVLCIEALTLVAIALSFLAAFGSCRRWSNRWIVQKVVFAANALFLSLGTYSIGLMQSSSVKSEMYPIWAVSFLTLLCCVDSVTAYSLDYKSQLWKMLYQLCLYCGYVLLMSISTMSSEVGNIAICVLSAITFIKGFHRSLALVLPSRIRNMIRKIPDGMEQGCFRDPEDSMALGRLIVDMPLDRYGPGSAPPVIPFNRTIWGEQEINMHDIHCICVNSELQSDVCACEDVCLSFSLSHLLQRRFLGLNDVRAMRTGNSLVSNCLLMKRDDVVIEYERAFKVIEVELAFLYDVFFTNNAFLYYYEAKTASIWAFTSIIGVCFVGLAAVIPGTRTTLHTSPGTIVVDTTTADLIITLVILVSLTLLKMVQLITCWTSNWARVAFACDYVRRHRDDEKAGWRIRLKAFLTRINWLGNQSWQNKLGQYSVVESISSSERKCLSAFGGLLYRNCSIFSGMLGLQYIEQVLQETWDSNTGDVIELHADVRAYIADFVSEVKCDRFIEIRQDWTSLLLANGVNLRELPYTRDSDVSDGESYTTCIMKWHIATCYCELAERKKVSLDEECTDSERETVEKNRDVAIALSKYCAYLVVSTPGLLPGRYTDTKRVYDLVAWEERRALNGAKDKFEAMERELEKEECDMKDNIFWSGLHLGRRLLNKEPPPHCRRCSGHWKMLVVFWVQALLYAAPSDNVEEHMQQLSQGGEFITHLWALLYHAGILRWQAEEIPESHE